MATSLTAIAISNLSHLLSVLVLFRLACVMYQGSSGYKGAYITACLHIVSPAGLFLSAPYGESLASLLNFSGTFLYCKSYLAARSIERRSFMDEVWLVVAGLLFGLATTVRSNGLLNGLLFALDLLPMLSDPLQTLRSFCRMRHSMALVLGGCLIAAGYAYPQIIAYMEYCTASGAYQIRRPWCDHLPPSIYTFVQSFYW